MAPSIRWEVWRGRRWRARTRALGSCTDSTAGSFTTWHNLLTPNRGCAFGKRALRRPFFFDRMPVLPFAGMTCLGSSAAAFQEAEVDAFQLASHARYVEERTEPRGSDAGADFSEGLRLDSERPRKLLILVERCS